MRSAVHEYGALLPEEHPNRRQYRFLHDHERVASVTAGDPATVLDIGLLRHFFGSQ